MSTLNVNNIDKESGSTLTIGGSGTTVNVSNMVPDVALSNRNLIINGAMQVAQRGTQVTGVTTPGYRTCDRFYHSVSNLGTWTVDQSTDAPNGFSNSFKVTCTTADASPAAADWCFLFQRIEGQNLQNLAFGTADAKSMTLSFWVKSNKTGAATVNLLQLDNSNKMISKSYTINSADTWEYKTISIPADTAGQIDNDNGVGLQVTFFMNSGSDYSSGSLQSTWSTFDQTDRNPSNLGVGGAVSDYFAITGVQLELGDVATPFEHRSYGQELALCQRYYWQSRPPTANDGAGFAIASGVAAYSRAQVPLPVPMRAVPSVSFVGVKLYNYNTNVDATTIGANFSSNQLISVDGAASASTGASSAILLVYIGTGAGNKITADAEL